MIVLFSDVPHVMKTARNCLSHSGYILSGKFNQDPLEDFFGKVRQSGGWSGNPSAKTAEQATNAIRLQTSSALDEDRGTAKVKRKVLTTAEPKIDDTPLPK